jgi:hypothetical protein
MPELVLCNLLKHLAVFAGLDGLREAQVDVMLGNLEALEG